MLKRYRDLLERLRRDRGSWSELAYVAMPDPKWTRTDGNYVRRYGVLLCLQYDRRDEDYDLIRYLFEQEVLARRDDPFQGETCALHLGAFLVARFRRPEDIPLFWEAKNANFDTLCAFNPEYLFFPDREVGLEFLRRQPERLQDVLPQLLGRNPEAFDRDHLEQWWQEKQRAYPDQEEDESPLEMAQRAITLDAIEEGRHWLDRWEAMQPVDAGTLHTLIYLRKGLDQPAEALAAAEKQRDLCKEDPWNYASALLRIPPFLVRLGRYDEALEVLSELDRLLARHRDWRRLGLARMVVEEMLDVAASDGCPEPIRQRAWNLAHGLLRRGVRASLIVLEKAEQVAGRVGDRASKEKYSKRAARERERIRREVG
jgi:tetratricopeptide (TPR) repeat protein